MITYYVVNVAAIVSMLKLKIHLFWIDHGVVSVVVILNITFTSYHLG